MKMQRKNIFISFIILTLFLGTGNTFCQTNYELEKVEQLFSTGNYNSVLYNLERYKPKNEEDKNVVYFYSAFSYFYLNKFDLSAENFDKISIKWISVLMNDTNSFTSFIIHRGIAYYHSNKFDKALKDFNEAKSYNILDEQLFLYSGIINQLQKNYAEAKSDFENAISINSKAHEAYYFLSILNFEQENFNEAFRLIEIAKNNLIQNDRKNFNVLKNQYYELSALINFSTKNFKGAVSDYEAFITKYEKDISKINSYGWCSAYAGNYKKAIEVFNWILEKDSLNDNAIVNIGWTHFLNNEFQKSIAFYIEALAINPENVEAYYRKGLSEIELNNIEEAKKSINKGKTFEFETGYSILINAIIETINGNYYDAIDLFSLGEDNNEYGDTFHLKHKALAYSKAGSNNYQQILNKVSSRMKNWSSKMENESQEAFITRTNEENRKKTKKEYFEDEFKKLAIKEAKQLNSDAFKLSRYDFENELFSVESNKNYSLIINVPVENQTEFSENWKSLKFVEASFVFDDKKEFLIIREAKITLEDVNKKYNATNKNLSLNNSIQDSTNRAISITNKDYNKSKVKLTSEINDIPINNKIISDVDTGIVNTSKDYKNRYALIIANEHYSRYGNSDQPEVNVDFAIQDGKIFKEYCQKLLGVPERQIIYLENATSAKMKQAIKKIENLIKNENGNAEVIFYYSGHGMPEETNRTPYLIPIDVNGESIEEGIALDFLYTSLSAYPSKFVWVVLDACFSGGARNQSLSARKGMRLNPIENQLQDNLVVFASSSNTESSGVYREKQHGYYTYYLLKFLKACKGEFIFKDLKKYLSEEVVKETTISSKTQTPSFKAGGNKESNWENWSFK